MNSTPDADFPDPNVVLEVIRDVMQLAYNRATPVCCGRQGYECCGSPIPEWGEFEQEIMDRLAPVERGLSKFVALKMRGSDDEI